MFLLVVQVNNMFVWWRVFVFMDLVFIYVCKRGSFSSVLNYYVLQECLGLIFLLLCGRCLQSVVVMVKIGLVPFHYWLYVVVGGLKYWMLMWFLTFQKLPFMGVLMIVMNNYLFWLLLVGFVICYFQLLMVKNYKFILVLSSTESFNWILFGYIFSFFRGLIIFIYYLGLRVYIIPLFNNEMVNDYEWLVILFYINIPLGVPFFVKFFVVSNVFGFYFLWFFIIIILIFFSFIALFVWMFVKVVGSDVMIVKMRSLFYIIYGLFFVMMLYYYSKSNYIILMWWSLEVVRV